MRLWHIDLIPYLPKSQLLAQWRELNSIFKKQDKHILINYIYNYEKKYLLNFATLVNAIMSVKGYKTNLENFNNYFGETRFKHLFEIEDCIFREHNHEYLTICYYNLKEKYMLGQKDFTKEVWDKLDKFYKKEMGNE